LVRVHEEHLSTNYDKIRISVHTGGRDTNTEVGPAHPALAATKSRVYLRHEIRV